MDIPASDLLFNAIRNGKPNEVAKLIEADPALLTITGRGGFTPLILATYFENLPITKLLIEGGANLDARDGAGNTALMGVCFKGFKEMANLLIVSGADVNAINKAKTTALSYAASFNQPTVAKLLMAAGADARLADEDGLTPADHARQRGYHELAKSLG